MFLYAAYLENLAVLKLSIRKLRLYSSIQNFIFLAMV